MNKTDEIIAQLPQCVEEIFESDRYKKYLDVASRFHTYSVNNCLLIAAQMPEATRVASYTTWQKMGRQVLKGSHGISIIAPTPHKKMREVEKLDAAGQIVLDSDGNPVTEQKEIEYRGFRVVKVFDISQTDGEPLPELAKKLTDLVEGYDDYLDAIKSISPVPIRFDCIIGNANGYYSPQNQEIVIRRGMPEEQTLKTVLHEVAHARLGHGGKKDRTDKLTKEIQAESVAYVCCRALGLATGDYSFGYIAGWSSGKDMKELKTSLQIIRNQADQMITGMEKKLAVTMELQQEHLAKSAEMDSVGVKMSI